MTPGDIGNPSTFTRYGIDARRAIVQGASPARVISEGDETLLTPFIDAAHALVTQGATLITTSCGFLAAYQAPLAASVGVPVITSSLLQCAALARPGILTIDAARLHPRILAAAGVPAKTPIVGMPPDTEFYRRIMQDDIELDLAQAQRDVVAAASRLVKQHPDITDIVLECTNMPPYRLAIEQATGKPVRDIVQALREHVLLHSA